MPDPPVLVLGASGFIGRRLSLELLRQGHAVRVLLRDRCNLPRELQGQPVDVRVGDASDDAHIRSAMQGVGTVFHLARALVRTWAEYQRHDIEPTRRIAAAALSAGVSRFVYTGTIDSLDTRDANRVIADDAPIDSKIAGRNLYARAKAAGESLLREMQGTGKLPLIIVRPGIVIGTGASPYHWGVGMWWEPAIVRLWGNGAHALPFVLVDDCAAALANCATVAGIIGHSFNFVGPPILSAREYVTELERATATRIRILPTPTWKFFMKEVAKWPLKYAVGHPNRERPSYADWLNRSHHAKWDTSQSRRLLEFHPTSDRDRLIDHGITQAARSWLRIPR